MAAGLRKAVWSALSIHFARAFADKSREKSTWSSVRHRELGDRIDRGSGVVR